MGREMRASTVNSRHRIRPYLFILLSLQLFWTIYCGIIFEHFDLAHDNADLGFIQADNSPLSSWDGQEEAISRKASFGSNNSPLDTGNLNSCEGNTRTDRSRDSSVLLAR